MKEKLFLITVMIVLVIGIVMAGCAKMAPVPAPTPAPTPPPPSAPTPVNSSEFIWPVPERVSINLKSTAIPQVESVATCIKKYGPDYILTWRARYFEERLRLPDDPYRSEHSSFEDVRRRGAIFNIWTGADTYLPGLPRGAFQSIVWPGVGATRIGQQRGIVFSSAKGVGVAHSHFASDEALFCLFQTQETYLCNHWIATNEDDIIFAPPYVPHGFAVAGTTLKIQNGGGFVCTGYASPPQQEVYGDLLLGINQSPEAKAKDWNEVWMYLNWENDGYGLKGKPLFYEPEME